MTSTEFIDRSGASELAFRSRMRLIDATPAAPESFDPIAALRRVAELAADFDDGSEWGTMTHPGHTVRASILAALAGPAVVTP